MSNLRVRMFVYIVRFVCMMISVPLHESAHALAASRLGDDTARRQGRLSLNPLAHFSPLVEMGIRDSHRGTVFCSHLQNGSGFVQLFGTNGLTALAHGIRRLAACAAVGSLYGTVQMCIRDSP